MRPSTLPAPEPVREQAHNGETTRASVDAHRAVAPAETASLPHPPSSTSAQSALASAPSAPVTLPSECNKAGVHRQPSPHPSSTNHRLGASAPGEPVPPPAAQPAPHANVLHTSKGRNGGAATDLSISGHPPVRISPPHDGPTHSRTPAVAPEPQPAQQEQHQQQQQEQRQEQRQEPGQAQPQQQPQRLVPSGSMSMSGSDGKAAQAGAAGASQPDTATHAPHTTARASNPQASAPAQTTQAAATDAPSTTQPVSTPTIQAPQEPSTTLGVAPQSGDVRAHPPSDQTRGTGPALNQSIAAQPAVDINGNMAPATSAASPPQPEVASSCSDGTSQHSSTSHHNAGDSGKSKSKSRRGGGRKKKSYHREASRQASSQLFHQLRPGMMVRICPSAKKGPSDVTRKHPELIDALGKIIRVPQYPCTWLTVNIPEFRRTVNVRSSNFRLAEPGMGEYVQTERLSKSIFFNRLHPGMEVIVLEKPRTSFDPDTDFSKHGRLGIIETVPDYPITWFTIRIAATGQKVNQRSSKLALPKGAPPPSDDDVRAALDEARNKAAKASHSSRKNSSSARKRGATPASAKRKASDGGADSSTDQPTRRARVRRAGSAQATDTQQQQQQQQQQQGDGHHAQPDFSSLVAQPSVAMHQNFSSTDMFPAFLDPSAQMPMMNPSMVMAYPQFSLQQLNQLTQMYSSGVRQGQMPGFLQAAWTQQGQSAPEEQRVTHAQAQSTHVGTHPSLQLTNSQQPQEQTHHQHYHQQQEQRHQQQSPQQQQQQQQQHEPPHQHEPQYQQQQQQATLPPPPSRESPQGLSHTLPPPPQGPPALETVGEQAVADTVSRDPALLYCHDIVMPGLMNHRLSWPFIDPIAPEHLGAFQTAQQLQVAYSSNSLFSLNHLFTRLQTGLYTDAATFIDDVQALFQTCYNTFLCDTAFLELIIELRTVLDHFLINAPPEVRRRLNPAQLTPSQAQSASTHLSPPQDSQGSIPQAQQQQQQRMQASTPGSHNYDPMPGQQGHQATGSPPQQPQPHFHHHHHHHHHGGSDQPHTHHMPPPPQ